MTVARVFCSWSIAVVLLLFSIAFSNSAESEKSLDPVVTVNDENGDEVNGTTRNLTGIPQLDYIHDPNLPRELNGYNLSDYPFYHRAPPNMNFSCDGRKDGFYADVEHKCQIYHHCLNGDRSDFVCANYTAFDQRTFICQFVSVVDCENSHMFFDRNKDLYVTKSTTTIPPVYNKDLYNRPRGPFKARNKPRPPVEDDDTDVQQQPQDQNTAVAPGAAGGDTAPATRPLKNPDYTDDDYYYYDYPSRPVARPRPRCGPRCWKRRCRNARRRGRRCRRPNRRPRPQDYYDDADYYDDDYDYQYYDDGAGAAAPRNGKTRRPGNTIPAGTSQVTSTSSSETPPPTTSSTTTTTTTARQQTTTTTEPPPLTSSESSGPYDSESITDLKNNRQALLTKTRSPFRNVRPPRPSSRQNDKTSTTSTTSTTTERAKQSTTTATTTSTTEVPQYIYDYEYYEDDSPMDVSSTTSTTTTTLKPLLRVKTRVGNSAAALVEKQRGQQFTQVKITEDSGTETNTIRRRSNSSIQTPTRPGVAAATPTSTTSTTTTTTTTPPPAAARPARFWQRAKPTAKGASATLTASTLSTTTTTTTAPYYQEYQDYEDDQPSAPAPTAPQQSSKFNPVLNQYGSQRQSYSNTAQSAPSGPSQQSSTSSSRGSSLSSSSYARPNKPYSSSMQQYSQSSSSSSSSSSSINNNNNNNNANYNSNTYHRQRSPPAAVPKPEFISLVDEDYSNPYASPVAVSPTSSASTRLHGSGGGGQPGYHQHPIRFFEQQHHPPFLFGSASEYTSPQLAFPPRNYPSPSNFQPYGHSTRRFSAHIFSK